MKTDTSLVEQISDSDIIVAVSPAGLDMGRGYARARRVLDNRLIEGGTVIEATVQGSRPTPYKQSIRLRRRANGTLAITGACSCPVSYNCKHVAAVLLVCRGQAALENALLPRARARPAATPVAAPAPDPQPEPDAEVPELTEDDEEVAPLQLEHPFRPVLQLRRATLPFDATKPAYTFYSQKTGQSFPTPVARLAWRYGPVTLGRADRRPIVEHEGARLVIHRDKAGERKAMRRLQALDFTAIDHLVPGQHPNHDDLVLADTDAAGWARFMLEQLPKLRRAGWVVEIDANFPVHLATVPDDLTMQVREAAGPGTSGIDWLELDLGVVVEGVRVDLVPALLKRIGAIRELNGAPADKLPGTILVPMPDGRLLPLPAARLEPFIAPLLELFAGGSAELPPGAIRLSRRNAAELARLEAASAAAGVTWSGGDAIRNLGRQLRDNGGIAPVALPDTFHAKLRGYQERGLAWLQFLRAAELGGVLADDMGLGKTVQALAHLVVEQSEGRLDRPALVICPTSLVANWQLEAARFAPTLRTLVLHGLGRAKLFGSIPQHDLIITTYPLLARDHETLSEQEWHVVILDEAQIIKNPHATTSQLARTLQARQRLCLSGTPLENHLGELWSLFDFLMPGFLSDRRTFTRQFRTPIEKGGDTERQEVLARRVSPFMLRRTKAEVASDLPAKTEITETIAMEGPQRAVYESIRLAMHSRVQEAIAERGMARSGIVILDALLKMRQACCDPRLLKLDIVKTAKTGSAKLERLMELLPTMLEDGRRILLFSQFTSMLALIEAELAARNIPFVLLTGDTKDRATPIRRFQGEEVPLFLISLKAGGVGLNLTAADTVIHYDPWWNPAVEDQATDRAHRIGQLKPVFVHRLVVAGSIEEKMTGLKQRKQALVNGILGGSGEAALTLNENDLEDLFAPLT